MFFSAVFSVALLGSTLNMAGQWHVRAQGIDANACLPGTLGDAALGKAQSYETWNAISNKQERYALRLANQFIGEAVWSRRVNIPASLAEKALELYLERVMWKSTLKVDGKVVGSRDSLAAAHVYSFRPGELSPGEHLFEIAIDNRGQYGFAGWSHAWGPTTQTRWNGIIGKFELRQANALRRSRVFASCPANNRFEIDLPSGAELASVEVEGLEVTAWKRNGNRVKVEFRGEVVYWSEWHPRLYTLKLSDGKGFEHSLRFGFRSLERRGNKIYLNGKPFWMRGNVDNCQFPLTGYPAMTPAEWRRQIRVQQLNGCNAMRFHTWTPPEAAFEAADELGFLMMAEVGYWADRWMGCVSVGQGNLEHDNFVRGELRRIQDAYGNHPSLMSVGFGNELGSCDFTLLDSWMKEAKAYDNRYLAIVSTARKVCESDDFMTTHHYPGIGSVRCWRRPHTDWDYEEAYSKAPIPVIAHEIGQWPIYPYWDDMSRFSGLLKPFDWMWMRSMAAANDTLRFTRRWHTASLKTNRLMYKDEVESFMRTPSCAGLQLLDMRDYTGQGEALVGWLDADFGAKSALSEVGAFSDIFRAVPFLARFKKYSWTVGETFEAKLQVRNLTEEPLPAGLCWEWSFAGRRGYMRLEKDLAPYEIATLGEVKATLESWMCKNKQTLSFGENSWNIWVFPDERQAKLPAGVRMTRDFDEMLAALQNGERVIYLGSSSIVGKGRFEPVYWSSIHFPTKDPTLALGTWFNEDHPAFKSFPTEEWMDWQWYSLAEGATVHVLRDVPSGFDAIAMPVSDIHFSEFLATMFELNALNGKLFVCGYNLDADTAESRALRRSIFNYVGSDDFNPKTVFTLPQLRKLMLADKKAAKELSSSDYRVESSQTEMTITVVNAEPVQGDFVVRFFSDADIVGEFEGKACKKQFEIDGEMRLVGQMNREDALDGKFIFKCRAKTGAITRLAGVEIVPR